jgi:hypothetical protein
MAPAPPLTLEDRFLIRELQARYSWATGTADVEAFGELFAPHARVTELGREFPPGPEGARQFLRDWLDRPGSTAGRQHWMHNRVFEGDGERCVVRSFVLVPHMNPVGTASVLVGFVGHCRDTFVKIDGAWRYEQRIVERWEGDVLDGFPEIGPVA